uniref:Exodeoxyribonuclease 7 large subunit n=1 Tax=Ammonifex degensii TaxID=42838 RepID=A0A7C2EJJ2_9THEO
MPIFTVSQVVGRIRELLESDPLLGALWVRGEMSNLSASALGHLYFTLKDQASQLRAVMFRSRAQSLGFPPQNGMAVIVRGYVSLYERDGNVQLYVLEMEPDGVGLQSILLRELKTRLAREGLFDPRRKRSLPRFPRRVGVATSLEGAAIRDIVTIVRRRWPLAELVIAPCKVQGEEAPGEIAAALARLNRYGGVDVIITGRGGGSFEELAAFNTETVVRAIFASQVPVVSAVGHERDETLADLAADARAATPSAAASLVVPDREEVAAVVDRFAERLRAGVLRRLEIGRLRLRQVGQSRAFTRPWETICSRRVQIVDNLAVRLTYRMRDLLQAAGARLAVMSERLDALSPLKTLARGYSVCRCAATGKVVTEAKQVVTGDEVEVVLYRGRLACKVDKVTVKDGNAAF